VQLIALGCYALICALYLLKQRVLEVYCQT